MWFCTDETTLAALIKSNMATPLSIKFNGVDYQVAQKTMCICSHLVREMINDNVCECVEINQKYVSTDIFEMLLPFFNTCFLSQDIKWNPNTIVEALLLSDYLQSTWLHDWAVDHIMEHHIFSGSLFHHTVLPFRLFEQLMIKGKEKRNHDSVMLSMWTEYTNKGEPMIDTEHEGSDEDTEVPKEWKRHLIDIDLNMDLDIIEEAMERMPTQVFKALSPVGLVKQLRQLKQQARPIPGRR